MFGVEALDASVLWFGGLGSGFRVQGSGFRVQDSGFIRTSERKAGYCARAYSVSSQSQFNMQTLKMYKPSFNQITARLILLIKIVLCSPFP